VFSVFLELVKRVGIFIIIGQTIQHFGISKKYEKYMKLVISFMVAAQIVFAFAAYMKQIEKQGFIVSGKEYMKAWEADMQRVEEMAEAYNMKVTQNLNEQLQQAEVQSARDGNIKVNAGGCISIDKITIP